MTVPPAALAPEMQAALRQEGFQALCPLAGGQQQVWLVRWRGRLAVVKVRQRAFCRRLIKEAHWLRWAAGQGLPVPRLLAELGNEHFHALMLAPVPADRRPRSPSTYLQALIPLHQRPAAAGWGPLRADLLPRWPQADAALQWYLQRLKALAPAQERTIANELQTSWPAAKTVHIHGDLHRGNFRGRVILDWESVALADSADEAARLALAGGWSQPWRWLGLNQHHPRWRGAWLRSLIESASYPGPRRHRAWALLTAAR
ncbi:MAG: hypothetical protein EA402_12995 [Planctomycetota bacterium]|nr:MAG: hypothetical protein EA402_12995 [Planctomycetota bacterium]